MAIDTQSCSVPNDDVELLLLSYLTY